MTTRVQVIDDGSEELQCEACNKTADVVYTWKTGKGPFNTCLACLQKASSMLAAMNGRAAVVTPVQLHVPAGTTSVPVTVQNAAPARVQRAQVHVPAPLLERLDHRLREIIEESKDKTIPGSELKRALEEVGMSPATPIQPFASVAQKYGIPEHLFRSTWNGVLANMKMERMASQHES